MRIAFNDLQHQITGMEVPDPNYWRLKLLDYFARCISEVLGASFDDALTITIGDELWRFTGTMNCNYVLLRRVDPKNSALEYTIMPKRWAELSEHMELMRFVVHPVANGHVEAEPGPDILLFDESGALCSEHILEPYVIKLLQEATYGPM